MVILGQRSFSFEHLNGDSLLIVLISGEHLRLFGGNVRSLRDDFAHDSTDSFNTQRKRSGINNDNVSSLAVFTANDPSLDGSAVADGFIRVDTSVGLFSIEEFLHELSDFRDSGRSSDKDNLINFVFLQS